MNKKKGGAGMRIQADGGAIIGKGKAANDRQAAVGCLTVIAVAAAIIYFLFFTNDGNSLNLVKPYKDAGFLAAETEAVVRVQSDVAEIVFDDRAYQQGDIIHFNVLLGEEGLDVYPTKYIITKIDLVSPVKKELYLNSQAGFGDSVTFWKNTLSNASYNEKTTVPVDLALDGSIIGADNNQKRSIEIYIEYIFAQVLGDTFIPGSSSQTIELCFYKTGADNCGPFFLRDPNQPIRIYAVKNDDKSWTVEKNFEKTEIWDRLVSWSPIQDSGTNTVLYAGVKDNRYDYVLDYGSARKTSFEGPGFSAFGSEAPIYGKDGKVLFCARRGDQWCMIYDGTEFPFHDGIGASSITLLDDGRFLYAALDDGLWSIFIASPQGAEFPVYAQMYGIRDPVYDHPVYYSSNGKIAFAAIKSKDSKTACAVYSKQKAVNLNEKSINENIVADRAYSDISDFWWSPKEELVYAGKSVESKRFCIVINGMEYTYDKAQKYLLAQCTGKLADRKDEVINTLNKFQSLYKMK
jgi:hypothetical protein